MKKLVLTFALLFTTLWVASAQKYFGEKITEANAIEVKQLPALMKDKQTLNIKLKGKIEEVCQKKGCWMKMDLGNGTSMRIKFKDYGFFVPKNAAGKTAIIEGVATKEIIDVATLRHYAEDAGKSKKEIEAITQPKEEITFEAKGVIIK
ncbi:MAG: DUF4920 domain-containing protein [Raineya sp.]|nr:DUF4920 domain-containing protein [Raineya sp.]MDW8296131.1 DUF4920 domain-containing protein [Raineya sp.]